MGLILTAYQAEDLLPRCLEPWVAARRAKLGGDTFTICGVSMPFEDFDHGGAEPDRTRALLGAAVHAGDIDHVIVQDRPMKETEARGEALRWLVGAGCDLVWQIDADEVFTQQDIQLTMAYVITNQWVAWFRVSYRNLVFRPDTYLVEPFTPPRIHRVTVGGYTATAFWDDNNVLYRSVCYPDHLKRDTDLASLTVPKEAAWPLHFSWLNDDRSRRKVAYQERHFGHCGYRWDTERGLCFNEAFYAVQGLPLPETAQL